MSTLHKHGFSNPRDFVVGLLDCGWEPGHAFLEALAERHPDLDLDDVEDWVTEWQRETD